MSNHNPPGQQPPVESAQTEWIGSAQPPAGPPAAGPSEGGGRGGAGRWVAIGVAVAVVALVGGGAYAAYSVLNGGGPQPADVIPGSAIAYARIDLDPSAEQKINALRLLREVPQFKEATGITADTDDLRERFFVDAIEGESGCDDIDYSDDVEPWIGERAGAAAIPGTDGGEPQPLLVLQVTDEEAARAGIQALIDCGQTDETADVTPGIAFVEDYALIADQELVDGYAAQAEESPLSDAEDFAADMDALDGEGLASFWVDIDAVIDAIGEDSAEVFEVLSAMGIDELGTVSAALRAQSDALELVYAGNSNALSLLTPSGGSTAPADDVQALPESTMFAMGFTGGGESVDQLWQQLQELESSGAVADDLPPGSLEALANRVELETGFVLPDDLSTLLGEQFTLAVDGEGFDLVGDDGSTDLSTFNVGMLMRTDTDNAVDLVSRAQAAIDAQGIPFELAQEEVDDGLVVAANADYAGALAEGGDLGDSDVFDAAVADPDDAVAIVYVDFDKVAEIAQQVAEDVDEVIPPDAQQTLDVFEALGVSTVVDDDYSRTTVRLTFD